MLQCNPWRLLSRALEVWANNTRGLYSDKQALGLRDHAPKGNLSLPPTAKVAGTQGERSRTAQRSGRPFSGQQLGR